MVLYILLNVPQNIQRKEDGDCYHPQSFNIMTYFPLQPRYNIYTDSLGAPLDDGYIYIGIANFDPVAYPTKVSWDESGLYPVEFPVRTMGGYPLRDGIPARMFINLADNYEYSILIQDEDEVEVYSSPTGLGGYFAEDAGTLEGHPASYFAVDSEVVHRAATETVTGAKTFTAPILIDAATNCNFSLDCGGFANLSRIFFNVAGANAGLISYDPDATPANDSMSIYVGGLGTPVMVVRGTGVAEIGGNDILTAADIVESTFTPVIEGSTTAGTGTYTLQFGSYQKIGNWVHFRLRVAWSAHTGTGNIYVTGLPYTAQSNHHTTISISPSNLTFTGSYLSGRVISTTDTIQLLNCTSGAAATEVAMDTAADIYISGSYEAA